MKFSLMFFSSITQNVSNQLYDLVFEACKFADKYNFYRIWLPERHFNKFGYLHPNPSVLAAALSRETKLIRIAAGSVVTPLHHPIRIVEEWALVDHLSNGRVDLSFASGWHPNDFVFYPDKYDTRSETMWEDIAKVKRLWKGEKISVISGTKDTISIGTYPRPLQSDLSVWVTAARNPETFKRAGEIGANILTYLVDLGMEKMKHYISLYRSAYAAAGYNINNSQITVMLHTLIGRNSQHTKEIAFEGYKAYMESNIQLSKQSSSILNKKISMQNIDENDVHTFIEYKFNQIHKNLSLIGTVQECLHTTKKLQEIGVTEIASLIDFIPRKEDVLSGLNFLNTFKKSFE